MKLVKALGHFILVIPLTHNCLDKLPQKQAKIFKMKTLLNYETEAICNEMDITASNLWVIIHRARTAMASCMEDNWF